MSKIYTCMVIGLIQGNAKQLQILKTRYSTIFFSALLFLSIVNICNGNELNSSAQLKPEHVVLQLKWKHQFQFAGYYAAKHKGFYRDAGLDVEIVEASDEKEPANVVLQGGADFGIGSSDLILLRSQGYPVVVMAAIYQHSPLVFMALKKSGVDNIHDIVKKRVVIEPHAAELLAYLKYESIPISEVTILPHTFDIEKLLKGYADVFSAYITDEPFLADEIGLDYFIFNPRASGIDFYGDTLFTTESQIKEHPERVKNFLNASLKGWDYALKNSKEIVDLIYNQYSQRHSYEHLEFEAEKTRQLILPDVVEIGYINPGRWRHIFDTYSEMGMTSPNISLNGFIYERNPKEKITWIYLSLFGAMCVAGIVSFIAMRFYNLNRRIRREMAEKERVSANLCILEEKYRILVEHAPFPILISGFISEQLLYINPKAVQKLDITQEYAIGKPARDYYVNPEDRDIFLTFLKKQGYVENYEVLMKSAAGVQFWASLAATLILFEKEQAIFTALLDITEQKTLEKKLETMAMTDELTGLFNRRNFTQKGLEECQRARRYNLPLSMMMLDVDKFKSINDTYGHQAGDYVLKNFASLIINNIRDVDIAGRLGGEEFGLILPNTDADYALTLAERLRKAIEEYRFEINGKPVSITASIGVASFIQDSVCFDQMLNNADSAMYWAKNNGRNRVALYREPMV